MKADLYPGRGTWPDWNNLDILQRDRLPAHANLVTFPNLASCRHAVADNRRYLSPNIINLKSGWESRYYPDILQLPESILSFRSGFEPYHVAGGQPIGVGVDEVQTIGYPFPVTPPLVPSEQPVLVCRRTCQLPLTWSGVRKRLVMQGVSSSCHVFVNGKMVGYSQGSCLPAEFDINNSLHEGDNELFILIYPRCDGSYLEKQSNRPLTGLIREIWFEAVPAISIYDLQVKTSYQPDDQTWLLDMEIQLISYRIAMDSPQIKISLWQGDECLTNSDWTVSLKPNDNHGFTAQVQSIGQLTARTRLAGILDWNDEKPFLYDLFVTVEDRGGHELCSVHQAVGFRTITRQDDSILINGRSLQMRAAVWPSRRPAGKAEPSICEMIAVLRQLKQNNFNALYLKDYPADPILLELCDIYGVLVIDEAPLEISHPLMLDAMREDSRWRKAALERLERLVRRDINHPCVVLWSAGIFRQGGALALSLADSVRQLDNTRLIHILDTPDLSLELDARMTGSFGSQQQEGWPSAPKGTGQCYYHLDIADSTLLRELKQIMRPLQIEAVDAANGAFTITNIRQWTAASEYQIGWLLLRDGQIILSGELDNIRIGPGEEKFVELYYGDRTFDDGSEYLLRFEAVWADDSLWATAGDEIFFAEFTLASSEPPDFEAPGRSGGRLRLESDRHHLIVSGSRFWMVFNRINGSLESWRIGDKELIAAHPTISGSGLSGLHDSIWRATDFLDGVWLPEWRLAGYDRLIPQVISTQEGCDGQSAVIEMVIHLAAAGKPACLEIISRYDIRTAGDLRVFSSLRWLTADLPPLPCFSLCLNMNRSFDQINWVGCGPQPGLASLHASSRRGYFSGRQCDPVQGVSLPGDVAGIFSETNVLTFKDKTGLGLSIRAGQPFGFAVKPAGQTEAWPGFAEIRPERQLLAVQLFQQTMPLELIQPLKAVWHLVPVVV